MFEFLDGFLIYVGPFLGLLTAVVFVHEMGHFLVARLFGVPVEIFSVGFGRALVSWRDRAGTIWKIGWLPLGGYVKFLGDEDAASVKRSEAGPAAPAGVTMFHDQPLYSRAAVVAAGPFANFLFAIFLLAVTFATVGQPFTPPVVDKVFDNTAASSAGILNGDRIVNIGGQSIQRFEELQVIISNNPDIELEVVVERDGYESTLMVTPGAREFEDRFGNKRRIGFLGVSRGGSEFVRHGPVLAVWYATRETYNFTVMTLRNVWEMIARERPADELRGVLGIAQMSGQAAQMGFESWLRLTVLISISLGLINLFPIPILDGGHLVFYAFEMILRRPISERIQEFSFRIGLVLVITLMLFGLWNDLVHLKVFEQINRVFS